MFTVIYYVFDEVFDHCKKNFIVEKFLQSIFYIRTSIKLKII